MGVVPVGHTIYSPEMIVRAFEYFSTSQSLYNQLRRDFKLPSTRTLTQLISKVSKLDDKGFLRRIFHLLPYSAKQCIVMFDEVYVKKMMTYHGGIVFGTAANDPTLLANTVLGLMVSCLLGGPTFLSRMIPVSKLNGEFLAAQLGLTVDAIKSSGGAVLALICDNNRTNQSLFRKIIPTVENKPWFSKDNSFLLFDYVHLIKSIRNNWLTEKIGELVFEHYGDLQIAKWEHLRQLQAAEAAQPLLRLSKLTEKSVTPKHTEKQSVPLCLQVFCDETATALLTHSSTKDIEGIDETANFIKKVV